MKTKIVLTVLAVMMLGSTTAYSQKVVVKNDMVIIDASAIPHTTVKKARTTKIQDGVPAPADDINDIASAKSNEKVYRKFEVSKEDNSVDPIKWKLAVDTCANSTYKGRTGWRLPTQRELMLIMILKSELDNISGFTPLQREYWSATESGNTIWRIHFLGGEINPFNFKSNFNYVRCIRDID